MMTTVRFAGDYLLQKKNMKIHVLHDGALLRGGISPAKTLIADR